MENAEQYRGRTSTGVTTTASQTDAKSVIGDHAATLKDDLQTLKTDAAEAGADLVHQARESAVAAKDTVLEKASEYGDQVAEYHDTMCRTVRKHPTAAVLVSIGAGILLGRLLGGR